MRLARNKYGNRKINVGGNRYDSAKEARRHQELKLLERAGLISDLQTQVKFVLIPAQREPDTIGPRGGRKPGRLLERELAYVADFVYMEDGKQVVEDVKGYKGGNAYAIFSIKRKLMLWVHCIKVRET